MILNILIIIGAISVFYYYFKADSVNPTKHELTLEENGLFATYYLRWGQSQLFLFIVIAIRLLLNRR
jgi:hypothetical protein